MLEKEKTELGINIVAEPNCLILQTTDAVQKTAFQRISAEFTFLQVPYLYFELDMRSDKT